MHSALERLLAVVRPKPLGAGRFEASHPAEGGVRLFGGQVLAQGMAAAGSDSGGAPAHSLHAYFLRKGSPLHPILFEVRLLRESRAFRTVEVIASQRAGPEDRARLGEEHRPILQMSVSYHDLEPGPEHQIPMDDVGPPAGESFEHLLLRTMTPDALQADDDMPFELPVEIRSEGGMGLFSTEVKPPNARCWIRTRGSLPDDPELHQLLFAYASDYAIISPALNPYPATVGSFQAASLDHAIWFHRPFRVDEWLLFELDSPVGAGGRGLGRGLLYTQDGSLVASCVQESLLRPRDPML